MPVDPDDVPELTEVERARWAALDSAARGLGERAADGALETEDVKATLTQIGQIPVDVHKFTNALHVPEDAGEHEAALRRMLLRIPEGWGRWIRCQRGWYPLIIDVDAQLAAVCPEYELQQVKQKYGTLRYYCDPCQEHWDDVYEAFEEITEAAEQRSRVICEFCGRPGAAAASNGWVRTLCDSCIDESGSRYSR